MFCQFMLLLKRLKKWAVEKRSGGIQLSCTRLLIEARSSAIKKKYQDSPHWIFKFMKKNQLVKRAATSVGQHLPVDWENKLSSFKDFVERNKEGLHLSNVGNMDGIPVTFDKSANFTIEKKAAMMSK